MDVAAFRRLLPQCHKYFPRLQIMGIETFWEKLETKTFEDEMMGHIIFNLSTKS